jgi:flagellar basal-body rod protein FlgG
MFRALYTAASGMTAQQLNLDNIANNLANSSTSGFQARRLQFSDLLYQNEIMPGSAATQQTTVAVGLQIGLGTRPSATEVVQTQGALATTGNTFDLAIQGAGFFQILLPNGETGYTRQGSFHPDAQGTLVTADGNPVQPAVTIPADAISVTIGADGTVRNDSLRHTRRRLTRRRRRSRRSPARHVGTIQCQRCRPVRADDPRAAFL